MPRSSNIGNHLQGSLRWVATALDSDRDNCFAALVMTDRGAARTCFENDKQGSFMCDERHNHT